MASLLKLEGLQSEILGKREIVNYRKERLKGCRNLRIGCYMPSLIGLLFGMFSHNASLRFFIKLYPLFYSSFSWSRQLCCSMRLHAQLHVSLVMGDGILLHILTRLHKMADKICPPPH